MAVNKPEHIMEAMIATGVRKTQYPLKQKIILGLQAGAFIALAYLLFIRVTAPFTGHLEELTGLIGAFVFPVGLILTLLAGGELLTGNMLAVPLASMAKEISLREVLKNWTLITVCNFAGAVFIAYVFGHVLGLTETGPFLTKTISIAEHKLDATFLQAFISGIGCNWLVALAIWISNATEDGAGKIMAMWFPTMAFVAIGFQHVVANMFVIPAAIFAGHLSWIEYFQNFVPVFLGNAVGGSLFVAMVFWNAYQRKQVKVDLKSFPLKKASS